MVRIISQILHVWNSYLHLGQFWGFYVAKYSSTMEHLGIYHFPTNPSYGYGSIPIHTIFRGMNIHLPAILMFTRGIGFWPIPICHQEQQRSNHQHVRWGLLLLRWGPLTLAPVLVWQTFEQTLMQHNHCCLSPKFCGFLLKNNDTKFRYPGSLLFPKFHW